MAEWLIFGAGFAAGTFVNWRDFPVAATLLGVGLLVAGIIMTGGVR
jgi:hypothetical protein